MVLGLTTAEWTAVGTIALVLVTIAYVVVTGVLAHHARKSADAAETSSKGAERAAEAAEKYVRVAEASLSVDFIATYVVEPDTTPHHWLDITWKGDRVFVHEAQIMGAFIDDNDDAQFTVGTLERVSPTQDRALLHRDEHAIFYWRWPRIPDPAKVSAQVTVLYSIAPNEEPLPVTRSLTWGG